MRMEIRQLGDPILHKKCDPVTEFSDGIRQIAKNMVDTAKHHNALGLASPQIGNSKSIIVIRDGDDYITMFNPMLMFDNGEYERLPERCLSIDGVYPVTRPTRVYVNYQDENGEFRAMDLQDIDARIFLHEWDHVRGILIIDHARFDRRRMMR